ncbi:MAG: ribose-phosphate diphosphokinase, partial [Streptococcus salivarius]
AEATGLPLGKVSSRQFSDGEIMINIEESVRGDDIYIIQSTSNPVNDHLWELLIMIDACKRASANSVNVVMPYFGYARQDRIAASREPITAKLIANMLVKAGVNRVLTLDLHAVQVQGFFDIPVDNLFTMPLFAEYYNEKGFTGSDVVVVSPKNSGVKRARSLADTLMHQSLSLTTLKMIQNAKKATSSVRLKEKQQLVDDILNTGKTFAEALKSLNVVALKTSMQLLVTVSLQEVLPKSSTLLQSKKSW